MIRNHQEHINFIWTIANLLRGPYRPAQYRRVMLPMTVLRRSAIISHAVTKGLDPNAPMKDSGVEWMGKVALISAAVTGKIDVRDEVRA